MRYFVVVNSLFLGLCVTLGLLLNDPSSTEKEKYFLKCCYFAYIAFLDLTLVVSLAGFGYKFSLKQRSQSSAATRILPRSQSMFLYVNMLLVIVYSFSFIFNLLSAARLFNRHLHFNKHSHQTAYELVAYFVVCEVIPIVCITITLWKRASKSKLQRFSSSTNDNELRSRSVANSVDDQKVTVKFASTSSEGTSLRYSQSSGSSAPAQFAHKRAPPVWWKSFVDSIAPPPAVTRISLADAGGNNSDAASDDEYMMFREVAVAHSATGEGVQFSPTGFLNAPKSPGSMPISDPSQVVSLSPLVASGMAGTPPSFDVWLKQQNSQQVASSPLVPAPPAAHSALALSIQGQGRNAPSFDQPVAGHSPQPGGSYMLYGSPTANHLHPKAMPPYAAQSVSSVSTSSDFAFSPAVSGFYGTSVGTIPENALATPAPYYVPEAQVNNHQDSEVGIFLF
jgi:hypothetical protein